MAAAGMITGWGAHHVDTAHWGMNTELTGPVEIWGTAEFPTSGLWDVHGKFLTHARYANGNVAVTGLSHVNGAISMARDDPGTATGDFFVVIGDLVGLDAQPNGGDPGYAVFGHVVDGMDVVHVIFGQPRSSTAGEGVMKGQMLAMPVKILTARRAQ